MLAILYLLGTFVANLFTSRRRLEVENLFLRHQLNIALRRTPHRLRLRGSDRALLVWMTWLWRGGANHKNRAGTLPLSSSASRAYHRGFLRRRSPFGPNRAASGGSSTKATGFIVVVFADVEPHRNDFPRAVSIDENQHEQRGTDESNQDGRRLSRAGARGGR